MFKKGIWLEIFQSIRKNRLRSVLSGFTITFAILIFTILFGIANGLKNTFAKFFVDDASNTIFIWSGTTSKPYKGNQLGRKINFANKDFNFVKEKYGDKVQYITARIYKRFSVSYKGNRNNFTIRAVHPEHQYLENTKVTYGRYINNSDITNRQKTLVIGKLVEKDLFKNENPIGKYLNLQGIAFKVIGVFEDEGGDREERIIYMPVSTAQRVFARNEYIDQINLTYNPKMNFKEAISFSSLITRQLKERFSISPKDQRAIRVRNIAESKRETDMMIFVLGIIILFVCFGTLVAGIIGISNMMVYIVKERTKELGIRKVLGAEPKDIIEIILLESVLITTIAGYVGMIIGVGVINFIGEGLKKYFITNPSVENSVVLGATIVLIIAGIIAGYVPAKRAAEIKPIIALQNE